MNVTYFRWWILYIILLIFFCLPALSSLVYFVFILVMCGAMFAMSVSLAYIILWFTCANMTYSRIAFMLRLKVCMFFITTVFIKYNIYINNDFYFTYDNFYPNKLFQDKYSILLNLIGTDILFLSIIIS